MKYNESTESLSSGSLSSSCSEGNINHVISQHNYKSSSLSSSYSEGNAINHVISEPNYKGSLVSTKAKSSSELEPNSSEDDGSPSSVSTSNFKEEKQLPLPGNGKKSSQKGPPCMLNMNASKDSVLLKGEWPENTSDGTDSRATKGSSQKIKAWVARQAGGLQEVKEEGKNPLDKEDLSNLLIQMLQERSPPPTSMPPLTRGLRHEPVTLVKSNSVSATKADNILKLDYITASSHTPTPQNKLGHRLSTGDSPLYVQKRYGSQGPASLRTGFPSPGTPSRSSFSGVPTSMIINNKAYMMGKFAVNEGNGKLLPVYNLPPNNDQDAINPGRLSVGFSSRAGPPSKWDDAEKWLVNSSPSHPSHLPPHPSKHANYPNYTESKKNPTNNKRIINVVASSSPTSDTSAYTHTSKDTNIMHYQSRSLVPLPSPSSDSQMHELSATMSDSELSNTQEECKVFVRSTSHKHMKESDYGKHRNYKSQLARKSVLVNNSKEELLVSSSPVTLMQLERLKLGSTSTLHEQLPRMHDVYAVETTGLRQAGSCADGAPCGNDEVADTGAGGGLARLVVQAGKAVGMWGAGAMRDASTDVSPKVSMSRRDMGTQMTPVASSKTSRSATPLKNRSPVRHNTPTRAKSATTSAHSPARGSKANMLKVGNSAAEAHHIELQSCHLEKLVESGHVMCHAGSDSSTSLSTTSHDETSSSSWKSSLQDTVHACDHQSSSALKLQGGAVPEPSAAPQYTAWEEAERSKHMTKCAREEARIDAWESHQKAKAEAEMKKLEMKLERLRAQTTEKIMNKVAAAHLRAEEMRAAARAQQAEQLAKSLERANSVSRKGGGYFQESLGVCFSILP